MNCVEFETLLFDSLDREIASADVERMQAHRFGCASCRDLYSLLRRDDQQGPTDLPHDFATGVVAITSGRPCERAQLLLAASEQNDSDQDWLVAQHLENCPDCSAVARALARLQLDLPTLAEADPGADFVHTVMAATFGLRRKRKRSQRSGPHRLIERLIRRPRIALEGAYAAAMLMLMVGLASPSFSQLPVQAGQAWHSVAETARTAAAGAGDLTANTLGFADRLAASLSAKAVELGTTVSSSARDLGRAAWDGLVTRNVEEIRSLWNEKVSGAVEPDTSNPVNR